MAFAHNAMIRGINSIYNQAAHVHATKDVADFLFFVRSWTNWIDYHHNLEETRLFPSFEEVMGKPGFLHTNVEQHHGFAPGLEQLKAFARETKPEDYKYETLRSIIDGFASRLQEQLRDEIPTLLAMPPYDNDALLKVYRKFEAVASQQEKVESPYSGFWNRKDRPICAENAATLLGRKSCLSCWPPV